MLALHHRHEPIDTLTVTTQLRQQGVLGQAGGELAVDELAGWGCPLPASPAPIYYLWAMGVRPRPRDSPPSAAGLL